jgi:hypothetical protein
MLQKLVLEPLKEFEEKLHYYVLEIVWCVARELIFTPMGLK